MEIQNNGWAGCIDDILGKSTNHILMTVRDIYVDKVKEKWDLREVIIFNIKETGYQAAGLSVIEHINSH